MIHLEFLFDCCKCSLCAFATEDDFQTTSSTELTACDENPTCLLFPAEYVAT